ncbi:AAA family ATPase [Avibacterium paragallinarum]|uniref:ABC transporter n=2 Tax=Avibacterium paragallinarum TaxID=728 RepID=A0A0F5EUX9_AVIPA|nr:AAA family ATPase [Avibacterium paragallinarum]AZI13534.1 ABC transporter [Avibacterium paragallinarum]POY46684.1 ABC transporter [Avibacterium paragallinarum]QIR10856.1 AAA family ATPase [Avibacterium paragallinarum]QJE10292.1 AAA family ATPase [Avibacterium paragallinarum]QJE12486.1 AAA family ATPase [Avibacterium paragallinarum]
MYIYEIYRKNKNKFFLDYLFPIKFNNPISIFFGENGIGKSTIMESLAVHLGCPAEGGSKNFNFSTENTHIQVPDIVVKKGTRFPKDVFFYRAETFYTFMSEMKRLDTPESGGEKIKYYYGGVELHKLSHGESMNALYTNRFHKNGLYILDEPEASLSLNNQLKFIEKIVTLSRDGAQFIIATHSPIIMQTPSSELLEVTKNGVKIVNFRDTNVYYMYRKIMQDNSHTYLSSILNL